MIKEGKPIEVKCHFCNSGYTFTPEELKELLKKSRIGGLLVMRDGFIKVAAVNAGDPGSGRRLQYRNSDRSGDGSGLEGRRSSFWYYPELCLTGYTCGDLFLAGGASAEGAPGGLAAACDAQPRKEQCWSLWGFLGKRTESFIMWRRLFPTESCWDWCRRRFLPTYSEFYEARHFTPGEEEVTWMISGWEAGFPSEARYSFPARRLRGALLWQRRSARISGRRCRPASAMPWQERR